MDNFADQEQIIAAHQKTLTMLEVQAAVYTSSTIPVNKKIELEEKRAEVQQLKAQLEEARSAQQVIQPSTKIEFYSTSLMRSRVSDEHYIERDEAKKLLERFALALKEQNEQPLIFNICGIGGVGKTTLLGRLKDAHVDNVDFLEICFAKTNDIENPLKLMKRLHQQAINLLNGKSSSDAFTEKHQQFEAALFELSQKSIHGEQNSKEDETKITSWFERFVWLGAIGLKTTTSKQISLGISGAGSSTLIAMGGDPEGLQEWIHQLVRNHPVTKDRPDLQSLMLEPVSKLTQAFANSLIQTTQSRGNALVLILDTYEKAQSYLNQWLWQSLVEDTPLSSARVRLVVLGRRPLKADENWRKLHQDRKLLYEVQLVKFSKKDTEEYLKKIGVDNGGMQSKIYKATQGLPYYLDWVREQKGKGIEPDFSKGNQEVVQLLLQGLPFPKRKILQIISCCRWFDLSVIRYLLKSDIFGLEQNTNNAEEYFEWLKHSDFVGFTKDCYYLDDIARDVFRQAYFQEDRTQFRKTNTLLAQYFKQTADEIIDFQVLLPDPYEELDWRNSIIEFLYYSLFGNGKEGLRQYTEYVFAATYLHHPDIFITPYSFIHAEINEDNKHLLPTSAYDFFNSSAIALLFSGISLHLFPVVYEFNRDNIFPLSTQESESFSKQIELSIQSLLGCVSSLKDGFGKCVGLMYKSLRCGKSTELVDSIRQSQKLSEDISTCCQPKLVRTIFVNLYNLFTAAELYEDSLSCYQKAIELDDSDISTFLGQSFVFFKLKRYEDALESNQKAILLDPRSIDAWVNRIAILTNLYRYKEALESSEKAIEVDKTSVNAWVNKSDVLGKMRQYKEALESSEKAIVLDKACINAWANRSAILVQLQRYGEALDSSEKAIELDNTSVNSWLTRGTAFIHLGQYDKALESLQKVTDLDSKSVHAWISRGDALINLGRYDEALKSSQKATKLDEKSIYAWYHQGVIFFHLGRYEEALESYQQAINLEPKFIEAWIGLGVTLFALEQYEEVLSSAKLAIGIDDKSINAWLNQGAALINLGKYEESLESCEEAINIDNKSIHAWVNKGAALINLKRYDESLDSYNQAVKLDPTFIDAFVNQGAALIHLKRYKEALQKSRRAIKLDPTSVDAWINKGASLSSLNRHEDALKSYQQIIKMDRKVVDAWNRQGSVLIELERYEQSIESYQQATILDPKCVDAWIGLCSALCSAERYEEALEKSAMAIKLDPKSSYAWNRRCIIFLLSRSYDEALAALHSSPEIDSNDFDMLNTKALVLSLVKNFEESILSIDKAISLEPKSVLLKANRGIILARAGRYHEALIECEQAIEQDPNHEIGYYGKACCYAQQGKVDLAIESLLKAINIKPRLSRTEAKHNPDFDNIRETKQFQSLIYQES
jgi:tetratricopeptide (TPR) repeat protein